MYICKHTCINKYICMYIYICFTLHSQQVMFEVPSQRISKKLINLQEILRNLLTESDNKNPSVSY